ncbi:MAG: site-specific integrase [Rhodospirillaceae bacterium]|nr:site-specific integrase [Rhodospirillaceae bacterium]
MTERFPKLTSEKITRRMVDAFAARGKPGVHWDRDLPGFGVRLYPSGRIAYVVQSRGPRGSRRVTLGRHGAITPDGARKLAINVIDRIKTGVEQMPRNGGLEPDPTVGDLAKRCLERYVDVECKEKTATRYRQLLGGHIVPALGEMAVSGVEREHIAGLHHSLRETRGTANNVLWVLSKMFSLAEAWGWRKAGTNPCHSVKAYKANRRERFLNREEYRSIGRVLREGERDGSVWPPAVAAIRLLMLTGCRREEIATMRWDDVDRSAGHLRLRDSKTGARWIPLTPTAMTVLDGIEPVPGNPWVFVGRKPGARVSQLTGFWHRLRGKMGLEDVRLHDLRHSYASRALALGESLSMIGRLLGHASMDTTARYAHLARDTEKASVARVAASIEENILPETLAGGKVLGDSKSDATDARAPIPAPVGRTAVGGI